MKISRAWTTPNDTFICRKNVVMIGAGSEISSLVRKGWRKLCGVSMKTWATPTSQVTSLCPYISFWMNQQLDEEKVNMPVLKSKSWYIVNITFSISFNVS